MRRYSKLCLVIGMPFVMLSQLHAAEIDLEGLPAGLVVEQLSEGAGVTGLGAGGTIGVSGFNPDFPGINASVIFDSANPTGGAGGTPDFDLGTPNEDFGGPGIGLGGELGSPFENAIPLGNILIINHVIPNTGGDDIIDNPDEIDDSDIPGSFLEFDFSPLRKNGRGTVRVDSVTLMDIEVDQGEEPAIIELFGPSIPTATFHVKHTGDNGVVQFDGIGIDGVNRMRVNFLGSGAVASVIFEEDLPRACWATFGGHEAFTNHDPSGAKEFSFGGNVGPPPSGHLNVINHATGEHLRIPDVTVTLCRSDPVICGGNANSPGQPGGKKGFDVNVLEFEGSGDLSGTPVAVTGMLVDCGEPAGKKGNLQDAIYIEVFGSPYVSDPTQAGDVVRLDGGNIQLHPPTGSQ